MDGARHLGPFVVCRRTAPDSGESMELINDLIGAGKLHWDADEMAFASQPNDPVVYTIPGDDEVLFEVLDHPSVPEAVRDGVREYLDRAGLSQEAYARILAAARTRFDHIADRSGFPNPKAKIFRVPTDDQQQPERAAADVDEASREI